MSYIEILKQGHAAWNAWREDNNGIIPYLRYAALSYTDLSHTDLSHTDMSYADLRYANLRWANLTGTKLHRVDLRWANLNHANLSGADLRYAYLSSANLRGSDLSGADLSRTKLCGANLSGAEGVVYAGFDTRGWVLIGWLKDGQPWFNAGECHSFSKADALAHWGSPDYPDQELGEKYVEAVEFLARIIKTAYNTDVFGRQRTSEIESDDTMTLQTSAYHSYEKGQRFATPYPYA